MLTKRKQTWQHKGTRVSIFISQLQLLHFTFLIFALLLKFGTPDLLLPMNWIE